jgi:hypothetical protein
MPYTCTYANVGFLWSWAYSDFQACLDHLIPFGAERGVLVSLGLFRKTFPKTVL